MMLIPMSRDPIVNTICFLMNDLDRTHMAPEIGPKISAGLNLNLENPTASFSASYPAL